MNSQQSLFQSNEIYFQYAKSFENVNSKMSFLIINFGIQNIFMHFHKNQTLLTENEKLEFAKIIKEMRTLKDKLGKKLLIARRQ